VDVKKEIHVDLIERRTEVWENSNYEWLEKVGWMNARKILNLD
jgi:hypothetical protein